MLRVLPMLAAPTMVSSKSEHGILRHTNTPIAGASMVDAQDATDSWADTSSAFISTVSSDFISSQAQSMASVTTAPNRAPKQDFEGINSERLGMLNASEECEDETIQGSTYSSRGKGENAVELPFNRLAMMNNTGISVRKVAKDDDSEISEEE
jgi:hypothetical protein